MNLHRNLYSMDVELRGTCYVKAKSRDEAREKALAFMQKSSLELSGPYISSRPFQDPDLPEISMSPAFSFSDAIGPPSLVEEYIK